MLLSRTDLDTTMAAVYGDDLGDEFALDDFVADVSGGEDGAVSPSDDEDHTGSSGAITGTAGPSNRPPTDDPLRARKRKRREKDKEKRAKVRSLLLSIYRARTLNQWGYYCVRNGGWSKFSK